MLSNSLFPIFLFALTTPTTVSFVSNQSIPNRAASSAISVAGSSKLVFGGEGSRLSNYNRPLKPVKADSDISDLVDDYYLSLLDFRIVVIPVTSQSWCANASHSR